MQLSEHFELAEFLVSETAARSGIANEPTPEVIENLRWLCQQVLQPLRVKIARPVVIFGSSDTVTHSLNEGLVVMINEVFS